MDNHKEDNERANPKINDMPVELSAPLIRSVIYHIEHHKGANYSTWAKWVRKEANDPAIEKYLHKAWREAQQVISKMPPNT
ncbi:MAG: hypothetical protein Q8P40_09335, partial [Nitrospirota bacterium]|nr:hypothetical protein [Nitrospirota bacterium]